MQRGPPSLSINYTTDRVQWHACLKVAVTRASPVHVRRLEHFLALLGCHHVDTTRYSGHLLAPTIGAPRLRCLMLGHCLSALERLPAFFATVWVCWHDLGTSISGHCQQCLTPSCRGSSSFRRTRRRAAFGSGHYRARRDSKKARSRPRRPAPRTQQ
jgi:hypothetical protein